jgi:hypothetical protein
VPFQRDSRDGCGIPAALDGETVLPHGAGMNGFLAICAICREIMR